MGNATEVTEVLPHLEEITVVHSSRERHHPPPLYSVEHKRVDHGFLKLKFGHCPETNRRH